MFAKAIETLSRRIEDDERQLSRLSMPTALASLIEVGEDVTARWMDAPVEAKRRVAAILLSPRYLGQVRIKKAARRYQPVEERLVWQRGESK